MISPQVIVVARQMMREGRSMQQAALALGIIPSNYLDHALWQHIATSDAELIGRINPKWEADF